MLTTVKHRKHVYLIELLPMDSENLQAQYHHQLTPHTRILSQVVNLLVDKARIHYRSACSVLVPVLLCRILGS